MLKEYIDSFIKDLNGVLEEKGVNYKAISVLRSTDIETDMLYHTGEFPKILVKCDPGYIDRYDIKEYTIVEDENEISKQIDYSRGLLVKPLFSVCVICDDPEQNAILEDIICEAYSIERKLYVITEENGTVVIPIKKKENEIINRSTNSDFGCQDYSSNICIGAIKEGFSENVNYHPSKIAFDPYLRFDAIEKYIAYNDLNENLFYKLPYSLLKKNKLISDGKDKTGSDHTVGDFFANAIKGAITTSNTKREMQEDDENYILTDDEMKIDNDYQIINKSIRHILEKTEILDKNHDDPFIAKKVLEFMITRKTEDINRALANYDKLSYQYDQEKDSFYEKLKSRHASHIKQEKNRVDSEKKIKNKNMAFSAVGDRENNRYIDTVIQNLKARLQNGIEVYGGSTYMEFFRKKRDNELQYPCILVKSKSKFNTKFEINNLTFKLISNNNECKDYMYDFMNYVPYVFEIEMQIYNGGYDNNIVDSIKNNIQYIYMQGADIFVKTPNADNTYSIINLRCNMNYSKYSNDTIYFYGYNTVYYVTGYDKAVLDYDSKLQIALLQRINFYHFVNMSIDSAINEMNSKYTSCFDGKPVGGFDFLNGAGYKEIKRLYNERQYIRKEVFDNVFRGIVGIYPALYNCFMQGMPINQIIENMQAKKRQISGLINTICEDLNLPDGKTGTYANLHFRESSVAINDLIDRLQESDNSLLNIELEKYIDEKENEARESYEMRQYYEEHPEEEPQAGSGILSSMLRQGVQKANINRNAGDRGKRDLIGQAGCAQINGGSCSSCNIRRACSRYFF